MRKFLPIAATAMLAACTTTMPTYQAARAPNGAGYFSEPVDGGRHAVSYTGSKEMSAAQVAEFAMLRAAEITIAAGQEWFAVLSTVSRKVQAGDINNIEGRSGSVLSTGSIGTGAGGGASKAGAAPGVSDGSVPTGPSTGGFGGGDVPYQVLERWAPPPVYQTMLVIQMGSGKHVAFEGLEKTPEIYSAQAVMDQIRAKTARTSPPR
ncbi:MAG: hypothetical protein J7500_16920 [Sphingomonas sp.]|uniref:CC0125/CC1285 family lipoprotein n=1 Tax=Sphingomonas sp. TaxID=28214 RepID=UPI001B14608E|nr:hypothetical protein [Sphingomonas sp.]MBO9624392.1 hypothetical protein [Sphingomonas sp.]